MKPGMPGYIFRMAEPAADLVRTTVTDGVCTLTLNRGDKANALSRELIGALGAAIDAIAARCAPAGDIRVVVLAGNGKAFCAGMDLRGVIDDPVAMGDCRCRRSPACRARPSAADAG